MQLLASLLLLAAIAHAHCERRNDESGIHDAPTKSSQITSPSSSSTAWPSATGSRCARQRNYQGNFGVTDVNSPDIRCFQMRSGTSTATLAAGDRLCFVAVSSITHFGRVSFSGADQGNDPGLL